MMHKVTLLAPEGMRGQIHASGSGKTYTIAEDHTVTIDAIDIAPLLGHGFQYAPRHPGKGERPADAPPLSSVAPGSTEVGASAIDPAKREAAHRETELASGQENQDFGAAIPPHGLPDAGPASDAATAEAQRAEAREEVDTAKRAGADSEHRSEQAGTGNMGAVHTSSRDQAEARGETEAEPTDVHDAAYTDFKDHAGAEKPTIRGKTKGELDAKKMPPEGDHADS